MFSVLANPDVAVCALDLRARVAAESARHFRESLENPPLSVEWTVEYALYMQTIQVVLDEPLLKAADRAAHQAKVNRSALVRQALRSYLKMLDILDRERRDREGYELKPDTSDALDVWDQAASWPDE